MNPQQNSLAQPSISLEESNTHADYFYCQKCKEVPKIEIKSNTDITTKCSKSDPRGRNQSIITLKNFITTIKASNAVQDCNRIDLHGHVKAKVYCIDCQKWFCLNCLNEHNKTVINHHFIYFLLIIQMSLVKFFINQKLEIIICKKRSI